MQTFVNYLQGSKNPLLKYISAVIFLLALALSPMDYIWANAKTTYNILILSSGKSPLYLDIIDTIQNSVTSNKALSKKGISTEFNLVYLSSNQTIEEIQNSADNNDLIISIGQKALIASTNFYNAPPIIVSLIPKQSYEKYRPALEKASEKSTAIFIDNPPRRQILLAKILLGDIQRLGVLIGNTSPYDKDFLTSAIQAAGIQSQIETTNPTDNLIRKLSHVIENSDAFIAFPDAQIFNRNTAKNILLTTYRQRTPVIAYSASYVRAGALAAVYSTPQQIAKQIGKTLIKILQSQLSFPDENSHPEEFEIAINQKVAKSLGISTSTQAAIKNQMINILQEKP